MNLIIFSKRSNVKNKSSKNSKISNGRLIDWLVGWLIGWLICWLIDWLIDWLINWLDFATLASRCLRPWTAPLSWRDRNYSVAARDVDAGASIPEIPCGFSPPRWYSPAAWTPPPSNSFLYQNKEGKMSNLHFSFTELVRAVRLLEFFCLDVNGIVRFAVNVESNLRRSQKQGTRKFEEKTRLKTDIDSDFELIFSSRKYPFNFRRARRILERRLSSRSAMVTSSDKLPSSIRIWASP